MNVTRLEELRNKNNLSKSDVANDLKVSISIYCRWEKNSDSIPTRRIYELANYYNINIDYLLGLTNKIIKINSNKDIDRKLVAKRTREIRNDLKLTLRQIAARLNTTSSTWSAYEVGHTLILSSFLIEICGSTNYSVDYILGRSNNKYRK